MKIVIFDLDGTLYQTHLSLLDAFNSTLLAFEMPIVAEKEIYNHIGKTTDDLLKAILPDNVNLTAFKQQLCHNEHKAVQEVGLLYPDIIETLEFLKKSGYELHICSNGSEEYIRLVLETTKIAGYFTEIHSSKMMSKSEATKQIVSKNQFAIFVGDTISDFEAANVNHIPSIAVTYGYGSEIDYHKATYIAKNPAEIIEFATMIDVFNNISASLIYSKKGRIIGINGVDTSGKTLFTSHFSRYLSSIGIKNAVLHIDDFHHQSDIRHQGQDEIESYYLNAFDYRRVIDEVLKPLRKYGSLEKTVCCLNLSTDKHDYNIHLSVDNETVLLVEGVLIFRTPLNEYFDGKIFLHIEFDDVIKRAKVRDIPKYGEGFIEKYMTKYIPVQKRYLMEWNPIENSDIVVNNQDFKMPRIIPNQVSTQ